ncbi:MAG: hypothetical protein HC780_29090 [Leptolyngbyaceae cyanobacterium CSU_1_3]|nr:hypothetical protein [Leptolyngbyaceae cyanobacterium CSU_1_3]
MSGGVGGAEETPASTRLAGSRSRSPLCTLIHSCLPIALIHSTIPDRLSLWLNRSLRVLFPVVDRPHQRV